MKSQRKKVILTGITPTGEITIGNYLGAIKTLLKYQDEYQLIIFSANLHSITQISGDQPIRMNAEELRKKTKDIIAIYGACGIDLEKNICFIQSDVTEHSEFAYILTCCTTIGQLTRMTQFKDKSLKNNKNSIPTGLLIYPCLMAADILLYNPDYVPIGSDQKQHIELCRDIALFLNRNYHLDFKLPQEIFNQNFIKIRDLIDPTKKMSKSSNNFNSFISLFDKPDSIELKIKKAKTDSENKIHYDMDKKPGISNLLSIYSGISDLTINQLEKKYQNLDYGEFKKDLILLLNNFLKIIQDRYKKLIEGNKLENILKQNRIKAQEIANKTLKLVKKNIGI